MSRRKLKTIANDLFQIIALGGMIYIVMLFLRAMGLI